MKGRIEKTLLGEVRHPLRNQKTGSAVVEQVLRPDTVDEPVSQDHTMPAPKKKVYKGGRSSALGKGKGVIDTLMFCHYRFRSTSKKYFFLMTASFWSSFPWRGSGFSDWK